MAKTNRSSKAKHIRLRSQKDGRLFAIALLKSLETDVTGVFASYQRLPGDEAASRKGPQSDVILRAFERVMYFGTTNALLGFFCVMTDFIGTAQDGYVYPKSFEKWERQGRLQYWRLPRHDLSKESRHG